MITPENITSHELIGLITELVESSNNQIIGLNGKIVFETKNMFVLDTKSGEKKIPKSHNKWKFSLDESEIVIDGKTLCKRPFDRLRIKS